jgi:hypothetical protein
MAGQFLWRFLTFLGRAFAEGFRRRHRGWLGLAGGGWLLFAVAWSSPSGSSSTSARPVDVVLTCFG